MPQQQRPLTHPTSTTSFVEYSTVQSWRTPLGHPHFAGHPAIDDSAPRTPPINRPVGRLSCFVRPPPQRRDAPPDLRGTGGVSVHESLNAHHRSRPRSGDPPQTARRRDQLVETLIKRRDDSPLRYSPRRPRTRMRRNRSGFPTVPNGSKRNHRRRGSDSHSRTGETA